MVAFLAMLTALGYLRELGINSVYTIWYKNWTTGLLHKIAYYLKSCIANEDVVGTSSVTTVNQAHDWLTGYCEAQDHFYDWDIYKVFWMTKKCINAFHSAVSNAFYTEWLSEQDFHIDVPGTSWVIPLVSGSALVDFQIPDDFDSYFAIHPICVHPPVFDYDWVYLTMTATEGAGLVIPYSNQLQFKDPADGIIKKGEDCTPEQNLTDIDVGHITGAITVFLFWANLFYKLGKSNTLNNWIRLMLSNITSLRQALYQRGVKEDLSNIMEIASSSNTAIQIGPDSILERLKKLYSGSYT